MRPRSPPLSADPCSHTAQRLHTCPCPARSTQPTPGPIQAQFCAAARPIVALQPHLSGFSHAPTFQVQPGPYNPRGAKINLSIVLLRAQSSPCNSAPVRVQPCAHAPRLEAEPCRHTAHQHHTATQHTEQRTCPGPARPLQALFNPIQAQCRSATRPVVALQQYLSGRAMRRAKPACQHTHTAHTKAPQHTEQHTCPGPAMRPPSPAPHSWPRGRTGEASPQWMPP